MGTAELNVLDNKHVVRYKELHKAVYQPGVSLLELTEEKFLTTGIYTTCGDETLEAVYRDEDGNATLAFISDGDFKPCVSRTYSNLKYIYDDSYYYHNSKLVIPSLSVLEAVYQHVSSIRR